MINLTRRDIMKPHFLAEHFAWLVRAWPAVKFLLVWAALLALLGIFWLQIIMMAIGAWGGKFRSE